MKLKTIFSGIIIVVIGFSSVYSQSKIEHIEPPNWWVGMKHTSLQIMIHGEKISQLNPRIDYEGVTIEKVNRVKNPNYLFIDLEIKDYTKAGTFKIVLSDKNQTARYVNYELLEREKGAADRKGFDNSDVLYLITPDRFANGDPSNDDIEGMREKSNRSNKGGRHGGDIEGIRRNLHYIKEMGFTAIWLNPVLENDMEVYSYHGYSTTDFYKVDPRFGTNDSYQKLAREARSKGIGLIMDMIVNHCGSEHWWMKDLPSPTWINQWKSYTGTNHRKTVLQDPYASEIDKKIFADGWFVETMPDLNQRNELMANYLTQNAIWWIEYLGLTGIRMDTYPYPDMDYMTEWTQRVMKEYPNFNVVGEEWFEETTITSYWQKGKNNPNGYTSELTSVMDFPLQVNMVKGLTLEETFSTGLIDMYEILAHDFMYPNPNILVTFPDNHDMSRIFTQLNEDYDLFKMAMSYVLTMRGIPQIYYGTEILMKNPESGDHGLIRSDFPGGWKGDEINGFTKKGLTTQEKDAQNFMKKLLNWRKKSSAIQTGKLTHFEPKDQVYVYFRYDENEKIMVILNKNTNPYSLQLKRFAEMLDGISNAKDVISGNRFNMNEAIELPEKSALILELK